MEYSNSSHSSSSAADRNRRNELKNLFSTLYSLVPHKNPRGATSLPEQIEEATEYIKELKTNVEKLKENRDKLTVNPKWGETKLESERVRVRSVGSTVEVVMATGLESDYHFIFRETIRLLQQHRAEILDATQSKVADNVFIRILAEVAGNELEGAGSEAARVSERLKKAFEKCKKG